MEFNKKVQIALGQMFNGLELKGEKYNFNAVKNLKDKIQDAKRIIALQEDGLKWLDKTKDARKEYMKIWSDAEGINRGADRQAGNVLDILNEATSKVGNAAKNLGVSEKSISEYTQGLKLLGELRENRGAYQEIKKELDKLK
jgi:hypothetical protein